MIDLELNGKKVGAEGLTAAFAQAAREGIAEEMKRRVREALSAEEFAQVRLWLEGEYPDGLALRLSGPEELLERARARLVPG